MDTKHNHLMGESSPYLLQHLYNPVDWYPWGKEALNKAKKENKPILLSIGYSACHWCHVMAHESFEDEKTAELMNKYFINIKVDREERPDLDKIYQTAHQIITNRSGGWPLTVFLTPDSHLPFFAGTYFPIKAGFDLPNFKMVLTRITHYFSENKNDVDSLTQSIQNALNKLSIGSINKNLNLTSQPIERASQNIRHGYDPVYGGFGTYPKFPQPLNIEFLLRRWYTLSHQDKVNQHKSAYQLLAAVENTLKKMALGGVYDQLGGGFFRYSVDEKWEIPHFEKMLYDNAQLLPLYAQAYGITHNSFYKEIGIRVGQWVMREMQSPEGGYYSTLSADTESIEGKYYYWHRDQIQQLLNEEEFHLIEKYYGLDRSANFEGNWHLRVMNDLKNITSEKNESMSKSMDEILVIIDQAKEKLIHARNQRVSPDRDEKILTSWNALMIKGMIIAGNLLQREDFIQSACQALDFIYQHLYINGRLRASYKDQRAQFMGYLDDYAFLIDALLEMLKTKWSNRYLEFAIDLADVLDKYFFDTKHGAFYFTASDHEALVQRPKPFIDEAIPAGNGVAAYSLIQLGHLIGKPRYLDLAEQTLRAAWQSISRIPEASISLMFSLEEYFHVPTIIVLRSHPSDLDVWQKLYHKYYKPHHLLFAIPISIKDLPKALPPTPKTQPTAYICNDRKCSAVIHTLAEFKEYLASSG